jgi:hypothetical protein
MAKVKRKALVYLAPAREARKEAAASARYMRLYRDAREALVIADELRGATRDLAKIARRLRGKKVGGARVGAISEHATEALGYVADDVRSLARALDSELRRIEREGE